MNVVSINIDYVKVVNFLLNLLKKGLKMVAND